VNLSGPTLAIAYCMPPIRSVAATLDEYLTKSLELEVMERAYQEEIARCNSYARKRSLSLRKSLGSGQDGVVFATDTPTAIKGLKHQDQYDRERDTYLRLQEKGVEKVEGFTVPELINFDDSLLIVEMSIVTPPFVLDFAGAYVDKRPTWHSDPEMMKIIEENGLDAFGDNWKKVKSILATFRGLGIYLTDARHGNIEFA
jgi:hypothetical protein